MKLASLIWTPGSKWLAVQSRDRDSQLSSELYRLSAQTNFAPPAKLRVIDLISEHDETVCEEFSSRGNLCLRLASPAADPGVKRFKMFVAACLASLDEQKTEQLRTMFTNLSDPAFLARRFLQRIESDKGRDLIHPRKPCYIA